MSAYGLHRGRGRAPWLLIPVAVVAAVFSLFGGGHRTEAQSFSSGSNGSDGALNLTTPGTIMFDPRAFSPPLDPDGDNIYHFTTITIGSGVTVRLLDTQVHGPVFWLASGAVQIDGTIDLNGENGHTGESILNNGSRIPARPGSGGFQGGVGMFLSSPAQPGSGPGGGGTNGFDGQGGGAGYVTPGVTSVGGAPYGNEFLDPLIGGSGGGGSNNSRTDRRTGGGGGGGALLIASSVSITVNGAITANGGNPGNPFYSGGGSGGALHLLAPAIRGTGVLQAVAGQIGSHGRIRREAFQHALTGSTSAGTNVTATLSDLSLPQNRWPSVRVVSVAGAPVPQVPADSFTTPDVTINATSAATITIEARQVPPGTVVKLVVIPENGTDQEVDSSPLVGTLQQSTATASVTLPPGFSRIYPRAKWTP